MGFPSHLRYLQYHRQSLVKYGITITILFMVTYSYYSRTQIQSGQPRVDSLAKTSDEDERMLENYNIAKIQLENYRHLHSEDDGNLSSIQESDIEPESADYVDEIVLYKPGDKIPEDDWFLETMTEHRRRHSQIQKGIDLQELKLSEMQKSRQLVDNHIKVAFIVLGEEFARQAVMMMKSVLMFTRSPIRFKAFVDQKSAEMIVQGMKSITWDMDTRYFIVFYDLGSSFSSLGWKRVEEVRKFATFGPVGAMLKLLMPKLFQNYQKILVVDVDTIFFTDIAELWKEFRHFDQGHMMAMGDEGYLYVKPESKQSFYPPYGLNNGFMLINVVNAEKFGFVENITSYFYYARESGLIISHHDQGLMNLYFADHPERLKHLACDMIFHGDLDPCSYTDEEMREKRTCSQAGKTGAYMLHGSSGRYRRHLAVSNSTKWLVQPGTQSEYYHLYQAFEQVDVVRNMTWTYWQPVLNRFVRERTGYCPESEEYSKGLLQLLVASLTKLIGS